MNFTVDKQTLDDLNLLGKYRPGSIFSLFNQVKTSGGEKLLDSMFRTPLTDADEINNRSLIFKYFRNHTLRFPFLQEQLQQMENYLGDEGNSNLLGSGISTLKKQLLSVIIKDERYVKLLDGIKATISVLYTLNTLLTNIDSPGTDHPLHEQVQQVKNIFKDASLDWLAKAADSKEIPFHKIIKFDYLFKYQLRSELKTILAFIYFWDVFITVDSIATLKNFCYANALPKQSNMVKIAGLYHPWLENAIPNSVSLHQENNVIFLTGANMAGKSTFMKTFGVSMYLAHMGFPVPAKEMTFSIKEGIYSSINVPDNLNMGYSHFYAEVLRVKKVAEEVSRSKDLVVIFDELFKGTNVKDAYEATLGVTDAFAEHNNCFFIISTHIIEVGEALKTKRGNVQFAYLPTIMEGQKPRYTYQLQEGITTDRQGMLIIENEGILEMLR
jgi:DNA mismatch repair protein MutS